MAQKSEKNKFCGFSGGKDLVILRIDSLHWKPYDLSMTFGKSEKSSIYASI